MTSFFKNSLFLMTLTGILFLVSCTKDDPALPDNLVAFDSDQLGTSASETQLTINITSLRAVSTGSTVTIALDPTGLTYGTQFSTEPAAASNSIVLNVPANTTSASFVVKKTAGALFDGTEKVKFTIQTVGAGLVPGAKSVLTLSFSEIVATGGSLEINGGGQYHPNKVFIDLSGNRQTAVKRTDWDLAFSSTDDFRVLLNSSNGMFAYKLAGKTDLASVTMADADAADLASKISIGAIFTAINSNPTTSWFADALNWIDNPQGDLTKTAIAAISATASENVVYIVNRGDGIATSAGAAMPTLGWKKVRIIRNGSNYTIQHADISSTTFASTTVTKDAAYRFNYFSFTNGAVAVEPRLKKWDIAWTGFTNQTATNPADPTNSFNVPYYFQDVIVQSSDVQTLQILNSAGVSYDNFVEANLAGRIFSSSQINIGSSWRSGGGPPGTPPPAVRTDRYYIIKDGDGNFYKLRFTALTTNGERGKPVFEYKLVKKA
ncbi:hypothetical protein BH09BAC3_BH09BAC3_31480 [soil metagenome]